MSGDHHGCDLSSIGGVKISISIPNDDVAFLDTLAQGDRYGSRSAVILRAVRLLRAAELGDAYEQAWSEWTIDESASDWSAVASDGLR